MATKKDEPLEAEVQQACLSFLDRAGFYAWRNHTGGNIIRGRMLKNANAGAPDVFALKDGAFYAIEFKRPSGKLRPHQLEWLARAKRYGAKAMVIRSLDELIEALHREGALDGYLFPPGDLT